MDEQKRAASVPSGWYLLGGLAIGAVAGLLLAPKKGSDMREDLSEWGRLGREKTRSLLSQLSEVIPSRVKDAVGVEERGSAESFQASRDKLKQFSR